MMMRLQLLFLTLHALFHHAHTATFQECKTFLDLASGEDKLLNSEPEYLLFVNYLAGKAANETGIDSVNDFEMLPDILQANYQSFMDQDLGQINLEALQTWAATQEQLNLLKDLCMHTEIAIAFATSATNTTYLMSAPPVGEVPASIPLNCARALVGSDSNRNNFVGEIEYVTFVRRVNASASSLAKTNFSELPGVLKFNFNNLAYGGQIDIFGASPEQWATASDDQKYYLDRVCSQTLHALNYIPPNPIKVVTTPPTEDNPTPAPTTESLPSSSMFPTPSPSSLHPTAQGSAIVNVTIYSAFVLSTTGGLRAAMLGYAGRTRIGIENAYMRFVRTVVQEAQTRVAASSRMAINNRKRHLRSSRRRHRHRRAQEKTTQGWSLDDYIYTLKHDSIRIFALVDSDCPPGYNDTFSCVAAYGEYTLLYPNLRSLNNDTSSTEQEEVPVGQQQQIYDHYVKISQEAIEDGLLQTSLDSQDPGSEFRVAGTTEVIPKPLFPSILPSTNFGGVGDDRNVAAVLTYFFMALLVLLTCAYSYYSRRQYQQQQQEVSATTVPKRRRKGSSQRRQRQLPEQHYSQTDSPSILQRIMNFPSSLAKSYSQRLQQHRTQQRFESPESEADRFKQARFDNRRKVWDESEVDGFKLRIDDPIYGANIMMGGDSECPTNGGSGYEGDDGQKSYISGEDNDEELLREPLTPFKRPSDSAPHHHGRGYTVSSDDDQHHHQRRHRRRGAAVAVKRGSDDGDHHVSDPHHRQHRRRRRRHSKRVSRDKRGVKLGSMAQLEIPGISSEDDDDIGNFSTVNEGEHNHRNTGTPGSKGTGFIRRFADMPLRLVFTASKRTSSTSQEAQEIAAATEEPPPASPPGVTIDSAGFWISPTKPLEAEETTMITPGGNIAAVSNSHPEGTPSSATDGGSFVAMTTSAHESATPMAVVAQATITESPQSHSSATDMGSYVVVPRRPSSQKKDDDSYSLSSHESEGVNNFFISMHLDPPSLEDVPVIQNPSVGGSDHESKNSNNHDDAPSPAGSAHQRIQEEPMPFDEKAEEMYLKQTGGSSPEWEDVISKGSQTSKRKSRRRLSVDPPGVISPSPAAVVGLSDSWSAGLVVASLAKSEDEEDEEEEDDEETEEGEEEEDDEEEDEETEEGEEEEDEETEGEEEDDEETEGEEEEDEESEEGEEESDAESEEGWEEESSSETEESENAESSSEADTESASTTNSQQQQRQRRASPSQFTEESSDEEETETSSENDDEDDTTVEEPRKERRPSPVEESSVEEESEDGDEESEEESEEEAESEPESEEEESDDEESDEEESEEEESEEEEEESEEIDDESSESSSITEVSRESKQTITRKAVEEMLQPNQLNRVRSLQTKFRSSSNETTEPTTTTTSTSNAQQAEDDLRSALAKMQALLSHHTQRTIPVSLEGDDDVA